MDLLIEAVKILAVLSVVYVAVTLGEYIAWVQTFSRRYKNKLCQDGLKLIQLKKPER